jgi:hypothetical protein
MTSESESVRITVVMEASGSNAVVVVPPLAAPRLRLPTARPFVRPFVRSIVQSMVRRHKKPRNDAKFVLALKIAKQ